MKIIAIILIIALAVGTEIYCLINNKNEEKTAQVVSIPSSGKVVVIDAGHGGEDRRSSK